MREQVAKGLVNKGFMLGQLDRPEDAIAVYEELDKRFGADTVPAVREQVAKGLVHKGFMLGQLDRPEDEIVVYEELDKRFGADTTPAVREQVAIGLVNKGFRLGQLDKPEDEIAVYDELDKRFGADTTLAVRELVAKGLNWAGFRRILLAKQCWPDEARRVGFLQAATIGLERAVLQCNAEDRAENLGNFGYSLFLSGNHRAAETQTLESLQLGGKRMLDAQFADAKLHRIESFDSQYEQLLNKLWRSFPAIPPKS